MEVYAVLNTEGLFHVIIQKYSCNQRNFYQKYDVWEGIIIDFDWYNSSKVLTIGNLYRRPHDNDDNNNIETFIKISSHRIDDIYVYMSVISKLTWRKWSNMKNMATIYISSVPTMVSPKKFFITKWPNGSSRFDDSANRCKILFCFMWCMVHIVFLKCLPLHGTNHI